MKINNLKINGFGNLENIEMNLKDGINLMSEKMRKVNLHLLNLLVECFMEYQKIKMEN